MKKTLTLLLLVVSVQLFAQSYPITGINISLPANPDANTANWGTGASMLTITAATRLTNGKIDSRVTESKIVVTIKKNGAKICGAYTGNSAPAANFNAVNKVWSGSNAVSLLGQDCLLPPGEYEICVQFFGYSLAAASAPLSEEKCKTFSIRAKEQQTYQPPQAITPANGTALSEADTKKPISFRWTAVVPRPQEPVTYRVNVWQLMQGQNGTQAMKANQPIITKDVDNLTQTIISNLISGPCLPPYLCDFIWNVQALNREGKSIGGNNGMSEAIGFSIVFPPPLSSGNPSLISPANGDTIPAGQQPTFTWLPPMPIPPGQITYKIKIVEIIDEQSPADAIKNNKPFFEKEGIRTSSLPPGTAPSFIAGKKYGWNVSIFDRWGNLKSSTASMFFASSCDVNLILKLRSVECLPATYGNNNYKICVSATYSSSVYNLTYSNAGSGFKAYHPSYSPYYGISNITPALQVQNNGASTAVNYCIEWHT